MAAVESLRSWRHVRYPVYVLCALLGLGMIWLPFKTFEDNESWADRLRADGVPVQAAIDQFVHKGRNGNTMHLRYEVAGVERRAEVGCWEVCLPAGTPVRIWVNPDDPGDFVTDFGMLSGHRGRFQGVIGFAGLVLTGLMVLLMIAPLAQQRHDRGRRDWQRQRRDQRRQQTWHPRGGTRGKPSRRWRNN